MTGSPRMAHDEAMRRLVQSAVATLPILAAIRYDLAEPLETQLRTAVGDLGLNIGARPPETPDERRRVRTANGFGHVFDGLSAVQYHREEATRIEAELVDLCLRHSDGLVEGGTSGFRCMPLGFQYQALLFAERRTLEYLAGAVASYFGRECHRMKGLAKAISDAEPAGPRDRVLGRLSRDLAGLQLSAGDRRSARDRLAHWEAVDAGVLNVMALPEGRIAVRLAGGGEDLSAFPPPADSDPTAGLATALDRRIAVLHAFILGIVTDLRSDG